jgi:5-methylcytosine-specific restriction endonuclease McrA
MGKSCPSVLSTPEPAYRYVRSFSHAAPHTPVPSLTAFSHRSEIRVSATAPRCTLLALRVCCCAAHRAYSLSRRRFSSILHTRSVAPCGAPTGVRRSARSNTSVSTTQKYRCAHFALPTPRAVYLCQSLSVSCACSLSIYVAVHHSAPLTQRSQSSHTDTALCVSV